MIDLIKERLKTYETANRLEEESVVKEILQEIALYGLWRSGFFEIAAFQGGTSLRILHGLSRFSEDLDFILKSPDPGFSWKFYLEGLTDCLAEFGLKSEILDKGKIERRIKQALMKDTSIGRQLNLQFYRDNPRKQQKIKLEIDIDPPENSNFEYSYLDFPLDFEICHQDLASNFSLKIHALLCRPFLKGRDWYDFNWYTKHRTQPNLAHLKAAIFQWGPWQSMDIDIDVQWIKQRLAEKIESINWREAAADVEPFLPRQEQYSLQLWNSRFFLSRIDRLMPVDE